MSDVQRATKRTGQVFTAEERAAMQERAREQRAAAHRSPAANNGDAEREVLAKVAAMQEADRLIAERLHRLVKSIGLSPRTWYGMPAYAKDGNVICFFQSAQKFKTRYATLGFSDKANLDEGDLWPTYYALRKMGASEEAKIAALVEAAVS